MGEEMTTAIATDDRYTGSSSRRRWLNSDLACFQEVVMTRSALSMAIDSHRSWMRSNAEHIENGSLRRISDYLDDGSIQEFRSVADCLDSLALVHAVRGILTIVDSRRDGWPDIARSLDYRAWALKIRAEEFFAFPALAVFDLTSHVTTAANLACCSEYWAGFAETFLKRCVATPGATRGDYWAERRFEPFVVAMLAGVKDQDAALVDRDLQPPYLDVMNSLDDEPGLRTALGAACDYHAAHIEDTSDEWASEFRDPPFDVLPCEVLITNTYLKSHGSPPIDRFDHPLVYTLGIHARLAGSSASDRLLDRVEAGLAKCYGR
jgi:hypothetical protein